MPAPLNEEIQRRMRRQGRRDTSPELAIRKGLHALGYRYRVDVKPERDLRCRGDLVFTRRKVVVFVDGCFWHSCPIHATAPKNNAAWWREKLDANIARDRRNDNLLRERGWTIIRLWEHVSIADAIAEVIAVLEVKRPQTLYASLLSNCTRTTAGSPSGGAKLFVSSS